MLPKHGRFHYRSNPAATPSRAKLTPLARKVDPAFLGGADVEADAGGADVVEGGGLKSSLTNNQE